jgi:hypothetical protein
MSILCTMKFLYVLLPSPQSSPWQGEEVAKRQVKGCAICPLNISTFLGNAPCFFAMPHLHGSLCIRE